MSNPFDLAWAFLKEEIKGPSGEDIAPKMKQNQVYNSIPSQKQGAGLSFYTGGGGDLDNVLNNGMVTSPVGMDWVDSVVNGGLMATGGSLENQYTSQMIRQMNHHATRFLEQGEFDPENNFGGKLAYDHRDYPNPLPPEQLEELTQEYQRVVPAEHHMPSIEEILKLRKENRVAQNKKQYNAEKNQRREREKGPENIFARKRD